MTGEKKESILELQEKHMAESMKLIDESINHLPTSPVERQDVPPGESGDGLISPPVVIDNQSTNSGGPDKINDIRNKVAKTPEVVRIPPGGILDPDRQSELLEIIKQRSDGFERLLQRAKKQGIKNIETVAQKFRDELLHHVRARLREKNYMFNHSQP
jgi:hypothetical protein